MNTTIIFPQNLGFQTIDSQPNSLEFVAAIDKSYPTDGAPASGGGGGGSGGPAPFLLKTYDMVDDSSTDAIVSWSSNKNSFVVWNPPEFARLLLPTYFKHNNFSSFIRQLNTYGFRKIDPERWEFGNDDFMKDQKHLLKNIHRRKPIHSHSQPQGSLIDSERATFDEEIERLSREKSTLEANLSRFKQQSVTKSQLEDLSQRVSGMEQKQENLLSFLEKAAKNPNFVEHLTQKIESMDFSTFNKKRKLPLPENTQLIAENSFLDNHSIIFQQASSDKLKLELSPAVSDINFISRSTQSSNEDDGSPEDPKDTQMRTGIVFTPETLELSDTGTSFTFKMDSTSSRKEVENESPRMHSTHDVDDGNISFHLSLTLASSPLQVSGRLGQETAKSTESIDFEKNRNFMHDDASLASSRDPPLSNQGHGDPPARPYNDGFWEQFLTERPGCSDTEEASSNYRANHCDEQEERSGHRLSRNGKNMEQLSL